MSVSIVQICNAAIGKIGANVISAVLPAEDSEESRLCNAFFWPTVDEVLRSHPWNCAIHRKSIAADSTTPAFDYDYRFQLPSNPWCL